MKKKKLILLTIISLFTHLFTVSQWVPDRKAFNIRSSYRNGEYDMSSKLCDRTISGYEKGRTNNIFSYLEALEFKLKNILETSDRIKQTESTLNKLLETALSLDNEKKSFQILSFVKVSSIFAEFGFHKQSKQYLDKALQLYSIHKPSEIKARMDLYSIYTLNKNGYYDQAYKIAQESHTIIEANFSEEYLLGSATKSLSGTYKGKYLIEQKRNIADFLNETAQIKHNQGNYLEADSLIDISYSWIKENLDPKGRDVAAFDNRMLKVINYQSLEKESLAYSLATTKSEKGIDGMLKSYEKHFNGYSYYETSEQFMAYEELLAKHYWKTSFLNTGKRSTADSYYQKHKSFYKRMGNNRNNVNVIKAELLHLDKFIITNHAEDALPLIDSLFKKKNNSRTASFIPENHPNKRLLLLKAMQIYAQLGLKDELTRTITKLERLDIALFDEDSPIYTRDKLYIAMLQSDILDQHKEAGLTFGEILDKGNPTQLFPISNEYSKYDNEYSRLLIRLGKFSKAEARIKKAMIFASQFENLHEDNFVRQNLLFSELLIETSKIKEADAILSKNESSGVIYSHLKKRGFENNETIDDFYRLSMRKNIIFGHLKEAQNDYDKIKKIKNEDRINISPLYISTGKFSQAAEAINKALHKFKSTYGKDSRRLLSALNYRSNINAQTGNYSDASNLEALELTRKSYGLRSWQYADALHVEGESYSILGDYRSAIIELKNTLTIYENVYGKNHIKYASTLSDLSLARLYSGDNSKNIEEDLKEASRITKNVLGINSIQNASVLQNLSFYHLEVDEISLAETKLQESIDILNILGSSNYKLKLAQNYRVKGKVQQYNKEFTASESSFKKSLNYFKDIFANKEHLEIVQTQSSLAQLYFIQGERKDSKKTLNKTTDIYLNYINKYFNYLTEREKKEFWKKIKTDFEFYNTIAFENNTPSEVETVYNNILNTKAILLNSSKRLRRAILNTSDASVKKLFNKWSIKQETLIQALSSSNEELEKKGIDIQVLQKEVDQLEKTLAEKSNAFSKNKREKIVTWKDVREKLKADEFAIEIIRYRHFENGFTDNIKYKALILGKDFNSPKVVDLTNGNKLDTRYLSFYRNATKFRTNDPYSYKAFFKAIHDVVGDNKKLFLSLDGVYNLINIETLRTPDGLFMIDKNEIITVTNTKELVTKNSSKSINKNVLLIGNPLYYEENISSKAHDNINGGQNWSQLPGTEKEANAINAQFQSSNWETSLFTWDQAEEKVIKSIGKTDDKKYSYLHISTHGFFKPQQSETTLAAELDTRRGLDDPYLRSGLLFKNGGDIIDNNSVLNYNISDGVLTAKEVANLELENMGTVVLSACETGLGKVSSGEGVYGLQRAFQSAGAESVIISLFKVDDEITNLLMQVMTKKYLETGDKRNALTFAKKEVRKDHPDPIYWGSFVMSE